MTYTFWLRKGLVLLPSLFPLSVTERTHAETEKKPFLKRKPHHLESTLLVIRFLTSQLNHTPHLTEVPFLSKGNQLAAEWLADQAKKSFQLVFLYFVLY